MFFGAGKMGESSAGQLEKLFAVSGATAAKNSLFSRALTP
jgi:hypothetical protein